MSPSVSATKVVSLNAAAAGNVVLALCALDLDVADTAAQWVHLLPSGEIRTQDGRGPYRVADWHKLVSTSLTAGDRLILDENHSTDLAAPKGLPAPAAGWIVELQHRVDGLWGRVDWTAAGAEVRKGYRGISPALLIDKAGNVLRLLRASLVNLPNLKGLAALHQEQNMDLLKKLAAKLGLAEGTSEEAVLAAVETLHSSGTALQARLGAVAKAAGVAEDATEAVVLAAIQQLASTPDAKSIVALQAELTTVTTELNTLKSTSAKKAAEEFVDGAIKAGRVGVKPLRDHYVEQHQADPARVEKEIGALPVLNGQTVIDPAHKPGGKDAAGKRILTADEERTVQLMKLDRDAYIKTLDAQDAAEAVL